MEISNKINDCKDCIYRSWAFKKLSSEELQLIIATERESIGLEAEQRKLLKNVFEFRDDTAEEVMIPRTDIKFLSEIEGGAFNIH